MMEYFFSALIGLLVGSVPTAYVLLKKLRKINITNEGSGNVGAMNSYEVTGSTPIGLLVFAIDFLKGAASVYFTIFLFGDKFEYSLTALNFAVLGHCYSPWIKFRGGRGLATASGGLALTSPVILLIWGLFWLAIFLYKKSIHLGNAGATFLTGALVIFNGSILNKYSLLLPASDLFYTISICILTIIIFSKHIMPLKNWFNEQKNLRKER